MSQNDNKNIINNNTERHLPSENHSSGYNSSNVTSYSPGIQNEQFVHSTQHTVVDNLSNTLEHTSCYTNIGDLDHVYGPQTQSKQYKSDITSQDGLKINPSTRKQDTHSYEYYDISDSNVNPHAINYTNKNQNNHQDVYSHNQTTNRQANPGLFGTERHSNSFPEANAFVMGNDVVTSDDHMTKSIGYGIQGATYGEQVRGSGQFVNNSISIKNHTDRVHWFDNGGMKNQRHNYENNTMLFSPYISCNNMNQNFISENSNTERENGLSFSQNRAHISPTVHFRENTSAQSENGNFNTSQVHGQSMFAHGNNGTYGGDKSYNQLREYGNNTVKTNRKLKEPDVFDGQRTEWPDYKPL
ncbi:GATA zinc finger domain-containing protein 14-like [Mytilus trossulus]|uniref:GATA zinc finger domain-containing protein 14-like n=1 Tax=Mytilus trossulus TaxID=6551 RepID=UPI003004FD7E